MTKLFSQPPRPTIDQVFTPRNATVNAPMYVPRAKLENALIRQLNGMLHILVHGESGSGKSWLCKQVATRSNDFHWHWVNLAVASRLDSIVQAISQSLVEDGKPEKTSYTETKAASVSAIAVSGGVEHQASFELPKLEPFLAALTKLRSIARDRDAVIVLENLEQIFDSPDRMKELGSLIVLCDDARYASLRTRFLIIGVPSHVRDYYAKIPNLRTVATRLVEIPEVAAFAEAQTSDLVRRGFVDLLGFEVHPIALSTIQQRVHHVTLGMPLYVHEYCLELAHLINGKKLSQDISETAEILREADEAWLSRSLSSTWGEIESLMNSKETRVGRKNQVLYSLGLVAGSEFDSGSVEKIVRKEFPESTKSKLLNIGGMLAEIASKEFRVLQRTAKGDKYFFVDPKFKMCLRTLRKLSNGQVARATEGE